MLDKQKDKSGQQENKKESHLPQLGLILGAGVLGGLIAPRLSRGELEKIMTTEVASVPHEADSSFGDESFPARAESREVNGNEISAEQFLARRERQRQEMRQRTGEEQWQQRDGQRYREGRSFDERSAARSNRSERLAANDSAREELELGMRERGELMEERFGEHSEALDALESRWREESKQTLERMRRKHLNRIEQQKEKRAEMMAALTPLQSQGATNNSEQSHNVEPADLKSARSDEEIEPSHQDPLTQSQTEHALEVPRPPLATAGAQQGLTVDGVLSAIPGYRSTEDLPGPVSFAQESGQGAELEPLSAEQLMVLDKELAHSEDLKKAVRDPNFVSVSKDFRDASGRRYTLFIERDLQSNQVSLDEFRHQDSGNPDYDVSAPKYGRRVGNDRESGAPSNFKEREPGLSASGSAELASLSRRYRTIDLDGSGRELECKLSAGKLMVRAQARASTNSLELDARGPNAECEASYYTEIATSALSTGQLEIGTSLLVGPHLRFRAELGKNGLQRELPRFGTISFDAFVRAVPLEDSHKEEFGKILLE